MLKSKVVWVLALLLLVGMAQAGDHSRAGHKGMAGMSGMSGMHGMMGLFGGDIEQMVERLSRVAEKLELSDQQMEQVFAVTDAARDELRDLALQMHDNHQALREAAEFENYDADVIAELAVIQGELTTRMIVFHSQMRVEIMAIFSPEQRAKMARFKERRRDRHGS